MFYQAYQFQDDLIAPMRDTARQLLMMPSATAWWPVPTMERYYRAGLEMISRFELTHERPAFDIDMVTIGNRNVPIMLETKLELPFGKLLHFAADVDMPRPAILVVAPLSGHFSTLLRGTVKTLLKDHDVYVTDWANARDIPPSAGKFGVDEYVDYLIRFLEEIGPGGNILAVCQPCVQALVAVAVMSEDKNPATPSTMTLMAGPIDPRESPTAVNALAMSKPLSWFKQNMISDVPMGFPGAGRPVYPGALQVSAFMSMNMQRHIDAHRKLFDHLVNEEAKEADKIKTFYDEYLAVLDLTAEFYIETIDRVFQKAELATGDFTYHGRKVDPGQIRNTALLTVEGGRDDICGLGQTSAAHDLCRSLRPHLKRHHLQANVGHYGTFSGRRWDTEIYPVVRNMILAME